MGILPGKSPTFSVGIPTYNQADFLEETILSLLNQTRPPDEIVISDHFSTDRTPEIIAKYASRVRAVQPPAGTNLTGQYNFTLLSQTCDWITLLSSDDLAHPNYCEVLTRGASLRDDAVFVRAGWQNIDASGNPLGLNYMLGSPKVELPPNTLLAQKNGPRASFASFALRRSAFVQAGPILDSLESLADWGLFVQLAPFGSFICEDEIISDYRIGHDGDKFRSRLGMWLRDEMRMFYEVMPFAADRLKLADRTWIDKASRHNFTRYLAGACTKFSPEERAEIVPLFEPWAGRIRAQAVLAKFAAGGTVPEPITLLGRGKRLVRPVAQKLNARLRKQ
jgi:glycosyltransferase involved in cell wall biosynthesis